VNVYPFEEKKVNASIHGTREKADVMAMGDRTGRNRVVLKEGVWHD
jgi:hypothetical protein